MSFANYMLGVSRMAFCIGDGVWVVEIMCGKKDICRVTEMEIQRWMQLSDMVWGSM